MTAIMKRRERTQVRAKDDIDTQLFDLARVARVTKGGRVFSFRATVIAGDRKGKVGIGVAKGKDVAQAVEKASGRARKNMLAVPMENGTIPHEVEAKFGASRVLLRPQRAGRGLVAGGAVRVMCEKAGVRDISSKFLSKTHNKLNNALATMEAFRRLRASKRAAQEKKSAEEGIEEKKDSTEQASS